MSISQGRLFVSMESEVIKMLTIYDSYPPDKDDLASKKETPKPQGRPGEKEDKDGVPYSKYMDSRPLYNRPFERLLADWR